MGKSNTMLRSLKPGLNASGLPSGTFASYGMARHESPARIINADARSVENILKPGSIDFVITSPPYPNEKDYTRTTRLESVVLGLIRNRRELRMLKQNLVRSNTRGVYKADTDDSEIADNVAIRSLADEIEKTAYRPRQDLGIRAPVRPCDPPLFRGHGKASRLTSTSTQTGGKACVRGGRSGLLSAGDDQNGRTSGRYCGYIGLHGHRCRPVSNQAFHGDG